MSKTLGNHKMVETSYSSNDVTILLKDLSGGLKAMSTEERERAIQSGTHYSEMLPLEYKPTEDYMKIYNESLDSQSEKTALGIAVLAEKLWRRHHGKFVIVSLARAGIPVGILIRNYIKLKYNVDCPHYSISIIRGKGIDINAMEKIYETEIKGKDKQFTVNKLQFVDGWTGKGAISRQVDEAVKQLKESSEHWKNLSNDLAVLADPANICVNCGTHEDFLIPSACLNSTVSGLVSRTILREDLIDVENGDFHGAVYFGNLVDDDRSQEFIDAVEKHFKQPVSNEYLENQIKETDKLGKCGMQVIEEIAKHFNIDDVNKIKPGTGETTRVLLRRVPWKVLVNPKYKNTNGLDHIYRLCEEKEIPIEEYDLGDYKTCGIIKDLSADA